MEEVTPTELLSRYICSKERKKYIQENGRLRSGLFKPAKDRKMSVFRTSELEEDQIWELGDSYINRAGELIWGRSDLSLAIINEFMLELEVDDNPPRHANVINWPEDDDERLLVSQKLAKRASDLGWVAYPTR